jgi:hypothetical protein
MGERVKPSKPRRHFYVSAIDGTKKYLIAGPYETHAQALELVDAVKAQADKVDPRAAFMAWGTASSAILIPAPLGAFKGEKHQ